MYIILFLLSFMAFSQNIYTMQDLAILEKQKEYIEYLNHAKDIPPSKRDEKWEEMTNNMGLEFLKSLKDKQNFSTAENKLLDKISSWAIFKKNEFFLKKKQPLYINALKKCVKTENDCLSKAKKVLEKDSSADFSFEIAKVLLQQNKYRPTPYMLLDILKPLLKSNICSFYTKKTSFQDIVYSSLISSPASFLSLKIDIDCKKFLAQELLKQLYNTKSSEDRAMYHKILRKWNTIHSNDIYYYNLVQFLDDYQFSRKIIFVKWKTFKTLGKNSKLRDLILQKLFKRNPLTGKLLYNTDKRAITVLKAFTRYIPEYFNTYANKCLSYFKGQGKSPSADCHQLFKVAQRIDLFEKSKIAQYKKLTKF